MKPKVYATVLSLVVFIVCMGCASMPKSAQGPTFQTVAVPEGKAVVYFFRPKRFAMSATTIFMSIPTEADNSCAMVSNGYYAHVTDPGTLNVFAAALNNRKAFSIELKPGDQRFIQTGFGKWGPTVEFQEIPADRAKALMSQNRLIGTCT